MIIIGHKQKILTSINEISWNKIRCSKDWFHQDEKCVNVITAQSTCKNHGELLPNLEFNGILIKYTLFLHGDLHIIYLEK